LFLSFVPIAKASLSQKSAKAILAFVLISALTASARSRARSLATAD
jgi:hypothetical protein